MAVTSERELQMYQASVIEYMRENRIMSETAFETWFDDFRLVYMDENKMVFATSMEMCRKVIHEKYYKFVCDSIKAALDISPAVEIICDGQNSPEFSLLPFFKNQKDASEKRNSAETKKSSV